MKIKQNKLTLALATLMSSTALVSCGGAAPANNVAGAPSTPLVPNNTITKTQDSSLTITGLNTNNSLVSSVGTSGTGNSNLQPGVINNKLTNTSSQGNSSSGAFGVSTGNAGTNSKLTNNPNSAVVSIGSGVLDNSTNTDLVAGGRGNLTINGASKPPVAGNQGSNTGASSGGNSTSVSWASSNSGSNSQGTTSQASNSSNGVAGNGGAGSDRSASSGTDNASGTSTATGTSMLPTSHDKSDASISGTTTSATGNNSSSNGATSSASSSSSSTSSSTTSSSSTTTSVTSNSSTTTSATSTSSNHSNGSSSGNATNNSSSSGASNQNSGQPSTPTLPGISVNIPDLNLGGITTPSFNNPLQPKLPPAHGGNQDRTANTPDCDPNICNAVAKEVLATESYYASIELSRRDPSSPIPSRNIPLSEYLNGQYLNDAPIASSATIYSANDSQLKRTGYTGVDYFPKHQNWVYASNNYPAINYYSYPLTKDSFEINNPAVSITAADLLINGSSFLYGNNLHRKINGSGATVNELLRARINSGSNNIASNYRNHTTAGLQQQIGNNYSASNPANFRAYAMGESSFINTYISLEPARKINLKEYNPALNRGYDVTPNELQLETTNNYLNGNGVTVAVVDLPVNDHHPLLNKRVKVYSDSDNPGALANIRLRYKMQTGYDLPMNHGTEVALVLGAQQNQIMHKYQGIAPQVNLNSYEYILDTTRLAKTFKQVKADGNSIVNASFTFGRRTKDNNSGVVDELRSQALDWKNAPLYIFSTGNNDNPKVKNTITGILSDLVTDSTTSPITMVVTGATTDQQLIDAGYTGVNTLNLSPYAVACGMAAGNCVTGFFMNTVSDPELDISNSRFYRNELNYQLSHDQGKNVYGTSFATPQVTGVATLVKQMFPWMTANNLRQTILTTATDIGDPGIDPLFGWGLVNAGNAVAGPGAFAFGDFVVNIDDQAIKKQPGTNLNNWWFTNNIVGNGGLVYNNNTPYSLILTGNNTYTGTTKVLNGRLILFKSNSESPFEISANGAVNFNSNTNVNAPVNNFGYVQVLNSTLKKGLVNQGTANLMSANIEGDVTLGDNAILRNSGVSHITGAFNLVNQSVFVTDLTSLLQVSGTAKLDGAIGVQSLANYVPEDGRLYQIIAAGNFDPTFRRFSKIYSALNSDLSLVNFDVVYDDTNADVYIHYFQNRNASSNLSNRIANSLASSNSNLNATLNSGAANINRVLQAAAYDYARNFKQANVAEPVYSYVYSQNSSLAVEKKLLADLLKKYPKVTNKDGYLGFIPFVDDDGLTVTAQV